MAKSKGEMHPELYVEEVMYDKDCSSSDDSDSECKR